MTDYRVLVKYGANEKHSLMWTLRATSYARAARLAKRYMLGVFPSGRKSEFRKAVDQGMRVVRVSKLND